MTAHAYLMTGMREQATAAIDAFLTGTLGFSSPRDPDIERFERPQFSVDDARLLSDRAYRSPLGNNGTVLVIAPRRMFHQAQNALLKLIEEPPAGVSIIIAVPRAGQLLPTLRSRLTPLPIHDSVLHVNWEDAAGTFLDADAATRERMVAKLLDATKSDDDDRKQEGRAAVLAFAESLVAEMADRREAFSPAEFRASISDLMAFLPILHERSAPLKPILEHLRIAIPTPRGKSLTL